MIADLAYILVSCFIAGATACGCAWAVMEAYDLINQRQQRKDGRQDQASST